MMTKPETLVIFCPNWVGDVVMSTPVFTCLRSNFPDAKIVCVIRKYVRGVIEDGPWFDDIIDCNDKDTGGFLSLVRELRALRPDMAILLRNSFKSAVLARLGGARAVYGYKRDGRSFLLTSGPSPIRGETGILPRPMVDYYMEICRFLRLNAPEGTSPRLHYSQDIHEEGGRLLEKYGITKRDMVVGLNPGAKFGSSKCWPPEHFARLAELFEEHFSCRLLLLTGPGEEDLARSITDLSRAGIIDTGPDRVDLALLKFLVKRCSLLVTNDTGTRHYAVAFDVPVAVIMGPTNAAYTAANLEKTVVLQKDLDCSPCHKKKCPHGHHDCMTSITPEDVFESSRNLLEGLKVH